METKLFESPKCILKHLDNIFIEMTAKNCNQRCQHCYIDFPVSRKVKDFIAIDTIKTALEDSMKYTPQCIYLTGAEPMTHPDFNSILRLCLHYTNTCICTNGSLINEKKARFLKRVQDEGYKEIIFKLSMDHYEEQKNDILRCRGSFRQTISALKYLIKYGFNPMLNVTNYYMIDTNNMLENIKITLGNSGIHLDDRNITVTEWFNPHNKYNVEFETNSECNPDCQNGRILTAKGIYACPFLANDHRGRCGADFKDFSDKVAMESEYCNTCLKNKRQVFGINFSDFNS